MTTNEISIATAAKNGDNKAFESLYNIYCKKVYALARITVKNNSDAEDILQQTFINAWRNIDKLHDPSSFNTWIQRIALNLCNSLLRKKNIAILQDTESIINDFGDIESEEHLPAIYAERDDLRNRLGSIIDGLSEVQKQTLLLYYFDELKVEEIAQLMGCSAGTVKSRLHLARRAIRSEIEESERVSGQKFYGVAGIAMLGLGKLFTQQIEAQSISPAVSSNIFQSISQTVMRGAANAAHATAGAFQSATAPISQAASVNQTLPDVSQTTTPETAGTVNSSLPVQKNTDNGTYTPPVYSTAYDNSGRSDMSPVSYIPSKPGVKTGLSAGAKVFITFLVISVVIAGTIAVYQFTRGPHPSDILPKLEAAYNNQDVYAMIECYDPALTDGVFGVLNLFGLPGDALRDIVPFFSSMLGSSGIMDYGQWGTVKLTEVSTVINGNTATMTYNVKITYEDGRVSNFDDTIQTILVDGVWYISLFYVPDQGSVDSSNNTGDSSDTANQEEQDIPQEVVVFSNDDFSIIRKKIPFSDGYLITDSDCPDLFIISSYYAFNHSYGVLSLEAGIILPAEYGDLSISKDGFIRAVRYDSYDSTCVFFNNQGNRINNESYIDARDFREGYAAVQIYDEWSGSTKWGYINTNGDIAIPYQYDEAGDFIDGYAKVGIKQGWDVLYGIINTNGEIIVPLEFEGFNDWAYDTYFLDGMITVYKSHLESGVFNSEGKAILPVNDSQWVSVYKNGFARILKDGRYGAIDKNGNYVIEPKYTTLYEYNEGYAIANEDGWGNKWDVYDTSGNIVKIFEGYLIPDYTYYGEIFYSEGLLAMKRRDAGGEYDVVGYLDINGNEAIPFIYSDAGIFQNGLAPVQQHYRKIDNGESLWGLIDKNGIPVTEFIYTEISEPWGDEGFRSVYVSGAGWGIVDSNGKLIVEPLYDSISGFSEGLMSVNRFFSNDYGVINSSGEVVVPFIYGAVLWDNPIGDYHNGLAWVYKDFKWGVIDTSGNVILPFEYISHNIEAASLVSMPLRPFEGGYTYAKIADEGSFGSLYRFDIVLTSTVQGNTIPSNLQSTELSDYSNLRKIFFYDTYNQIGNNPRLMWGDLDWEGWHDVSQPLTKEADGWYSFELITDRFSDTYNMLIVYNGLPDDDPNCVQWVLWRCDTGDAFVNNEFGGRLFIADNANPVNPSEEFFNGTQRNATQFQTYELAIAALETIS